MERTSREIETQPCHVCAGRGWCWITSPWLLLGLSILCLAVTIFLGWSLWHIWQGPYPGWFGGRGKFSPGGFVLILFLTALVCLWYCIAEIRTEECWTCNGTGKVAPDE